MLYHGFVHFMDASKNESVLTFKNGLFMQCDGGGHVVSWNLAINLSIDIMTSNISQD